MGLFDELIPKGPPIPKGAFDELIPSGPEPQPRAPAFVQGVPGNALPPTPPPPSEETQVPPPREGFFTRLGQNLSKAYALATPGAITPATLHLGHDVAEVGKQAIQTGKDIGEDLKKSPTPVLDASIMLTKGMANLTNQAIGGPLRMAGAAVGSPIMQAAGKQITQGLAYEPAENLPQAQQQLEQLESSHAGKAFEGLGEAANFALTGGMTEALKGAQLIKGSTALMPRIALRTAQAGGMATPSAVNTYMDLLDSGANPIHAANLAGTQLALQTGLGAAFFSSRVNDFFHADGASSQLWNSMLKSGAFGTAQEAADSLVEGKPFEIKGAFGNAAKFGAFEALMSISKLRGQMPGKPAEGEAGEVTPELAKQSDVEMAKHVAQYYRDVMGSAPDAEAAQKAHDLFKAAVGKKFQTNFDDFFPGDGTIRIPGEEAYNAVKPVPKDVKVDGEVHRLEDPMALNRLESAEQMHENNVQELKNQPMTSADRHDAIKESGDRLAEFKRELVKEQSHAIEAGQVEEGHPAEYQRGGPLREDQGEVRQPEGLTEETHAINRGGGLPEGGVEAEAVTPESAFIDLPPRHQEALRSKIHQEASALAEDPEGTLKRYRELPETADGRIVGGDSYNKLLETYSRNQNHGLGALQTGNVETLVNNMTGLVHVRNAAIDRAIKENKDVAIMVGGQGSGKTTFSHDLIEDHGDRIGAVIDAPNTDPNHLIKMINNLKSKGVKRVATFYVDTDPETAFRRMLLRSNGPEGRHVDPNEFVKAHYGAAKAAEEVGKNFRNDPRALLYHVTDNTSIGGDMNSEGKNALESIRKKPPVTKEDLENSVQKAYLEEKGAGNVRSNVARSLETALPRLGLQPPSGAGAPPESGNRGTFPPSEPPTLGGGDHEPPYALGMEGNQPSENLPVPETRSPKWMGQRTKDILAGGNAAAQINRARRIEATKEATEEVAKMPMKDRYDVFALSEKPMEDIQSSNLSPEVKEGIENYRKTFENNYQVMEDMGIAPEYVENYMPRIWKAPDKAASFFKAAAKRPFRGTQTARKARTLGSFQEGIEAGLKPFSDNPFEVWEMAALDQDKFILANQKFRQMKDEGLVKFFRPGERIPSDWSRLDDSIAKPTYKNEKGETVIAGHYAAPNPVANAFNNYLSPGFTGKGYQAIKTVANAMNQASVSLNAYHLMFVSLDDMANEMARGFQKIVQDSDYSEGAKTILKGQIPILQNIKSYQFGKGIERDILAKEQTPEAKEMQEWLVRGGQRIGIDPEYMNQAKKKLTESFRQAMDATRPASERALAGAKIPFQLPFALAESISGPLMEKYIPAIKNSVYFKLIADELDRAEKEGRILTEAEKDRMARRIGDQVENRFGLMVYDNLFWPKKAKQIATTLLRSTGWNLGNQRDYLGSFKDLYEGSKYAFGDKTKEQFAEEGVHGRVPWFTIRLATQFASFMVMGMMGAAIHYLRTGKAPETMKDLYAPQIGGTDKHGKPNRMMTPGYTKDQIEETEALLQLLHANPKEAFDYASAKIGPAPRLVWQLANNRDWKGNEIYTSLPGIGKDPKRIGQIAKHIGLSFSPMSIQKAIQEYKQGEGAKALLPIAGIMPPPASINNTDAENLAQKLLVDKMPRTKTREKADLSEKKANATTAFLAGNNVPLMEMLKDREITPAQFKNEIKSAHKDWLGSMVKHLSPQEAIEVYKVASPEEKAKLKFIVSSRVSTGSKSIPLKERSAMQQEWYKMRAEK